MSTFQELPTIHGLPSVSVRLNSEDAESQRQNGFCFTSPGKGQDHALFTLDAKGRITSWNSDAERILGYSDVEALGRNFSVLFTPDDVERGQPAIDLRTASDMGRSVDERWHVRKNGERFSALDIITPVGEGNRSGFSIIVRDMTDRMRIEESLRVADRRKDEFLAMLAHELRNPLAPIQNGLDVLAMGKDGDGDTIQVMRQQVEHLMRLVDDLLDISRIIQGKVELRREAVALFSIIGQSVDAVRAALENRQQQLSVSMSDEAIWLDADPVRVVQVIENLLNNASKYSDRSGRIRLTVERENGGVCISVEDDGIGIEPELLPHVFDLFRQSPRSLDRAQGGLGIGLALVKNLVGMHDGSVAVFSEGPGRGSRFRVHLPTTKRAQKKEPHNSQALVPNARRILVVEDNVGAAKVLSALISHLGQHEVEMAHDGPSAVEKVGSFRPEIVLLDIGLPTKDGYEVARILRTTEVGSGALLVALTGYGRDEDRRRSSEAGFDEHLVKPVSIDNLRRLLCHPKLAVEESE